MQTFLPSRDFRECSEILDNKRLNKQIIEVYQILDAILLPGARGWVNHPAVLMWKHHAYQLCHYGTVLGDEWAKRGGKNVLIEELKQRLDSLPDDGLPSWFDDDRIFASHRAALLYKGEVDSLRKRFKIAKMGFSKKDITPDNINIYNTLLDTVGVPKFDNWYEQFNWLESAGIDYYWPVTKKGLDNGKVLPNV